VLAVPASRVADFWSWRPPAGRRASAAAAGRRPGAASGPLVGARDPLR